MSSIDPYKGRAEKYDRWYDDYKLAFKAELEALRKVVPKSGEGLEIGIGTGRFARALNISQGVEPSKAMRDFARSQNLKVVDGVAEELPFEDGQFDFVLMVTVICFLEDAGKAMTECFRVIRPGGCLIIGFIDRGSHVGRKYTVKYQNTTRFDKPRFYTPDELTEMLKKAGFANFQYYQTLFCDPELLESPEPVTYGHGEGSFVVIRASRV